MRINKHFLDIGGQININTIAVGAYISLPETKSHVPTQGTIQTKYQLRATRNQTVTECHNEIET